MRPVTPSAMNWEAHACPLCLQLERASGHAVSKDPNPTTSLPPGPPILDERWTNSWPLNVPTCSHNLPIDPEVYTASVYSPSQFITRTINEGARIPHPGNHIADIHDDDSTAACFSDSESMYETTSPGFTTYMSPKSIFRGSYYSSSDISDEQQRYVALANGDKSRGRYQECMPTGVYATSDPPELSTPPTGIYSTPTIAQYQEQKALKDMPQQSQESREGSAVASPRSSLRSNGKRPTPQGRYRCTCGRDYAQSQGLKRHQRESHEAGICMYCRAFAWGRPYRFREHIKKEHPGVDPDVALEEATNLKTRRSITINTNTNVFPQCASLSAEHSRWDCAGTLSRPAAIPPR